MKPAADLLRCTACGLPQPPTSTWPAHHNIAAGLSLSKDIGALRPPAAALPLLATPPAPTDVEVVAQAGILILATLIAANIPRLLRALFHNQWVAPTQEGKQPCNPHCTCPRL